MILKFMIFLNILLFSITLNAEEYVFKLKDSSDKKKFSYYLKNNNIDTTKLKFLRNKKLKKIGKIDLKDTVLLKKIKKSGFIEYIEKSPVFKLDNSIIYKIDRTDPYYIYQWWLKDIKLDSAWSIESGDSSIIVAFIDGGFWINSEEFKNNKWYNIYEQIDGKDNDNNGYINDIYGWNFIDDNNVINADSSSSNLGNRHGYFTSYIVGANWNDIAFAGINSNSKLMFLRVFNENLQTSLYAVLEAIDYALDHNAKVINMSFGGFDSSGILKEVLDTLYSHNIIVLASAGNEDSSLVKFPARYNKVIGVGSCDNSFKRSWFSNYGYGLDFLMPGESLLVADIKDPNNFYLISGTSFSTPILTGIVSLMCSIKKDLTFDEVYEILKKSTINSNYDNIDGYDYYYGWGIVDANKALTLTKKLVNSPPKLLNDTNIIINDSSKTFELILKIQDINNDAYYFKVQDSSLFQEISITDSSLIFDSLVNSYYDINLLLFDRVDTSYCNLHIKINKKPTITFDTTFYIAKVEDTLNIPFFYIDDDSEVIINYSLLDSTLKLFVDSNKLKATSNLPNIYTIKLWGVDKYNYNSDTVELHIDFETTTSAFAVHLNRLKSDKKNLFYPSPVKDRIYFSENIPKVEIYDRFGKLVLEKNYINSIDVSNLRKGIYILKIYNKNLQYYFYKL